MSVFVIIPARLGSTRLPGKPLADIGGRPMVVRVAERAVAAGIGRVAVATDSAEIAAAVEEAGYEAVITRADHESGSDRIFEALERLDPRGAAETVVNLQGDLPLIDPELIRAVARPLAGASTDIATLGVVIADPSEIGNPNVVKIVGSPVGDRIVRALYFTRAPAPWGEGPHIHHIGIYAYRRAALERFVGLAPSVLERRERLEQLRALEAGMRIDAAIVDAMPAGVDTPEDLARARALHARLKGRGQ
jgi:3-deoxy-manno-octulosonate cytidylyltransferase (CMP-KDO synthetase)